MPNRHNEDRRHPILQNSMKVTNWSEFNPRLRRRGSLTLWITEEEVAAWRAPARLTRGGQAQYSDPAIDTNLLLRSAFRMPLRQSQGLMASVFELLNVGLAVPDYSTVCMRSAKLAVDANTNQIVAYVLTGQDVQDPSQGGATAEPNLGRQRL